MNARSIPANILLAALVCAFAALPARADTITEADFGGDFAGDAVSQSLFTNIGLLSATTTVTGIENESGTPADAFVFTTNSPILAVTVSLSGAQPFGGGFGVSMGTGSVISYFNVTGTPDIFGSNTLAVPSVTSLINAPLPAGTYFIAMDDANPGIAYEVLIQLQQVAVPEPTSLSLFGLTVLGAIGAAWRRRA